MEPEKLGRAPQVEDAPRSPPGILTFFGVVLLGVFWILIEFAHMISADVPTDFSLALARLLRYGTWQVILFMLLGVPIATLGRWCSLSSASLLWIALGAATFVFLGPSAALGAYRRLHAHPLAAPTAAVGAAALVAIALFLISLAGRVLPGRLRARWPLAACIGWSLFAVPLLVRGSPPVKLGKFELSQLIELLRLSEFATASIAAALLLASGYLPARHRRGSTGAALLLIALLLNLLPSAPRANQANGPGRADVLFILLDTLRADHLGAKVEGRSLTPALDSFAENAIRFNRAYSTANFTSRAMPAIMTSLPAHVAAKPLTPAGSSDALSLEVQTLSELLKAAGYRTYAVSANPYVSDFYGYAQGFDAFYDASSAPNYLIGIPLTILCSVVGGPAYYLGLIPSDLYYARVNDIRAQATRILRRSPAPTLLYLQTMDMHGPYLPPRRYLPADHRAGDFYSYFDFTKLRGKGVLETARFRSHLENLRQRYAGEARFTDEEVGRLFDFMRDVGRWDETLVWVVADHGEAFGEHDWAGHSGRDMSSTLTHVPMLLKPPRSSGLAPRAVDTPVSTYDILPTTMSILGLETPPDVFGISLVDMARKRVLDIDRAVISDGKTREGRRFSCVRGHWKFVAVFPQDAGEPLRERALFNQEDDPGEERNVVSSHEAIAAELEQEIRRHMHREASLSFEDRAPRLDPVMEDRLRELGYVEEP